MNPGPRPAMRELGQICERRGAEIDQMLALQLPAGALAGYSSDALSSMLRQDRAITRPEFPRVIGAEAARDDPHAIPIEIQRPRAQFYQTFHQKPILGGYLSRVSRRRIAEIRASPMLVTLIKLSEGRNIQEHAAGR